SIEQQPFYHENLHYNNKWKTVESECDEKSTVDNAVIKPISELSDKDTDSLFCKMKAKSKDKLLLPNKQIGSLSQFNIYSHYHKHNIYNITYFKQINKINKLKKKKKKKRQKKNLKHCQQIESMIYHIAKITETKEGKSHNALTDPSVCVVEMGGGKASLGQCDAIHRIQICLQHLDLSKIDLMCKDTYVKHDLLMISKHVCGAATDFALRCIVHAMQQPQFASKPNRVRCIAIALCCRGKCSFDTYCGLEYLKEELQWQDFSQQDFEHIRQMSTWCVDGKLTENDPDSSAASRHLEIGQLCLALLTMEESSFNFILFLQLEANGRLLLLLLLFLFNFSIK
ncbi:hypothetical protein RFI_10379, partial [Reticulomyxa filosa]